jgi:hypothetical protein
MPYIVNLMAVRVELLQLVVVSLASANQMPSPAGVKVREPCNRRVRPVAVLYQSTVSLRETEAEISGMSVSAQKR